MIQAVLSKYENGVNIHDQTIGMLRVHTPDVMVMIRWSTNVHCWPKVMNIFCLGHKLGTFVFSSYPAEMLLFDGLGWYFYSIRICANRKFSGEPYCIDEPGYFLKNDK